MLQELKSSPELPLPINGPSLRKWLIQQILTNALCDGYIQNVDQNWWITWKSHTRQHTNGWAIYSQKQQVEVFSLTVGLANLSLQILGSKKVIVPQIV